MFSIGLSRKNVIALRLFQVGLLLSCKSVLCLHAASYLRYQMDFRKFLAKHPSIIGIIIGLFILGYIVVTIIMKRTG